VWRKKKKRKKRKIEFCNGDDSYDGDVRRLRIEMVDSIQASLHTRMDE
jgi:hypothetical protein